MIEMRRARLSFGDELIAEEDEQRLCVFGLNSQTEAAIGRCREILDDLQEPKTVGLQAVVEATHNVLPKLEEDLKALTKAYNTKRSR